MYGYGFNSYETVSTGVSGFLVWTIISVVVAIAGGIAIYFTFLKDKKELSNFLNKLRDFLNFKSLLLEDILKISYLILAIFITLYSFGFIGISLVAFLVILVVGNLSLRITYELAMILIRICQNTNEINKKLKK